MIHSGEADRLSRKIIIKENLSMSRRGENIYKRKDNRWEGRYIKGYDYKGKTLWGYVYAPSYRECREKLTAAKQAPKAKPQTNRKDFNYFCDEWLVLSRNRVKESTYVKYFNTVSNHIKPNLGVYLPQNLNTVIIEEFSNELLVGGLSPKTVRDILTVLKAILKHCRRQIGSTFPDIEVLYPKDRKKEMRVLSLEEQTRFVQYLLTDMDEVKFGILLALLTGMRIGEVCALRWEDISVKDQTIRVSSTMQRLQTLDKYSDSKTRVTVGEAKSETSKRVIPLTDYAVSLCERMQVCNGEAYILTGEACRFLEPRALQYRLEKYTAACNLNDVHFHVLRHTFATRCVEVGFEIKSLSEILGHASAKVTLDRYVHSSLELKRVNMNKLAAVGL